ncbi:hypothetical protein LZ198_15260 [Myxococcus sp. K15C18031901]|uniref:outer membrane beta-barrel protein n=1 Tax=Myxococcus dinghuensis TaxID=2906761 RepID=UPI0020A7BB51|nr:outer membrane beta-barrel protein [Myxococcus dinghuensis]MCP3100227.1 hypothetical protein [Myxococcus dinghuensis]
MTALLPNPSHPSPFRLLTPLLALLALPAAAQETPLPETAPKATGFAVGARLAYGIARGDAFKQSPMAGHTDAVIAPQVDLSYFFTPRLALNLQGQYGIGQYSGSATEDTRRGSVLRLGLGLSYHALSDSNGSPWVGAGVGLERLKTTTDDQAGRLIATATGFELLNLQAGIDFKLFDVVRVGPYFSGSAGRFLRATLERNGQELRSGSIEQKTVHFWFQPGVRVQVRL